MLDQSDSRMAATLVIPAHNESAVIGRLLRMLTVDDGLASVEIIVVCNGCQDDTALVARSFGERVRVLETPVASKIAALRLGDAAARHFPRLFVDADVEIDLDSVRLLADALRSGEVRAAAPRRVVPLEGCRFLVRAYYLAWQQLPGVRDSLWGRGVIGFAESAHRRVTAMPDAMSDDLALSLLFVPGERMVVQDACVIVHPPRTLGAVLQRRRRSVAGDRLLAAAGVDVSPDRTTRGNLIHVAAISRVHAMGVAVLVALALVSRTLDKRELRLGRDLAWARDDTSRAVKGRV